MPVNNGGHMGIRSRIRDQEGSANSRTRRTSSKRRNSSGSRQQNTRRADGTENVQQNRLRRDNPGMNPNRPQKRRSNRRRSYGFIRLLLLILVIAAAVFIYVRFIKNADTDTAADGSQTTVSENGEQTDTSLTEAESRLLGIKNSLEEGISVMETLRIYYPDDIVLYKDEKYIFTPIDESIGKHNYSLDDLIQLDDGEWQYTDGRGNVISKKGIDVSSHQGEINWASVSADGVEFAIIRALYRGYSSGRLVEDEQFKANLSGAQANGISTGVYIFTQAVTEAEVDEEIAMLNELLSGYTLDLPVVVDVEEADDGNGRMDTLSAADRTELIKYYCEALKSNGYTPMIYFNIEGAILMLDLKELEEYDKWFASYNTEFYYPYEYAIRQYSSTGSVDGIEGDVDLNMMLIDML